ncbi:hypothetical protein BHU09_09865 [Tannerella sp. oral taxon 808]|nr:hypothetical protein BHU09_09865 [Tannerella sp. oral taxon 808]
MNFWWGRSFVNSSSGTMVQTLEKSPVWLLQKGKFITGCNETGEYMDMHEEKAALYASDGSGFLAVSAWNTTASAD